MKILYIGQYSSGTTSKMRADQIENLNNAYQMDIIDTHIPFYKTNRIFRSFGFRYKKGPLIRNINSYVQKSLKENSYDLVWVDKGVFLNLKTIKLLRALSKLMVHFTPDPSFTFHKSKLFNNSLSFYDYVITTKSFEIEAYKKYLNEDKVIYVTQGFDKKMHLPSNKDFSKKKDVVFIGHYEDSRAEVIQELLNSKVGVVLAGIKWDEFAKTNSNNDYLDYRGSGIYGSEYVSAIQDAKIAWGAISKWIPELHTTRTFEIPACGTALLTERNKETKTFFNEEDVIFYSNTNELIERVKFFMENDSRLKDVTCNGYNKVIEDGYDYESILSKVFEKII